MTEKFMIRLLERFTDGWNRHDAGALMEFVSDDYRKNRPLISQ